MAGHSSWRELRAESRLWVRHDRPTLRSEVRLHTRWASYSDYSGLQREIIVNDSRSRRGNQSGRIQKQLRPAENVIACSSSLALDAVAGTNYASSGAALDFDDVAGIIYAHSDAAGNGDRGLKFKSESKCWLPFVECNKPSVRKFFLR